MKVIYLINKYSVLIDAIMTIVGALRNFPCTISDCPLIISQWKWVVTISRLVEHLLCFLQTLVTVIISLGMYTQTPHDCLSVRRATSNFGALNVDIDYPYRFLCHRHRILWVLVSVFLSGTSLYGWAHLNSNFDRSNNSRMGIQQICGDHSTGC